MGLFFMYTRPLVIMGLFYVQKIPYYYGTFLCTVVPYYYGTFLCTVSLLLWSLFSTISL